MIKMITKNSRIILSAILAIAAIGSILVLYQQESTTGVHVGYASVNMKELAKQSDVIVIGNIVKLESTTSQQTDKLARVFTHYTVNIEQELTGNYKGDQITITVLGDDTVPSSERIISENQKVVLFLTHTDESTVFGDAYVPIGGPQGVFTIDNENTAKSQQHGDFAVSDLIQKVQKDRSS